MTVLDVCGCVYCGTMELCSVCMGRGGGGGGFVEYKGGWGGGGGGGGRGIVKYRAV